MNPNLQSILDIMQQNGSLSADDKETIIKAVNAADKELAITEFKLERTEKVKRTTAILLEETIEELEQKRKVVEESRTELQKSLNELQATQEQLVQQEKLASLGQLTAGIAHEIKNPLNFVNNFSEVSMELIEEARQELAAFSDQQTTDGKRETGTGAKAGDVTDQPKNFDVNCTLSILNDIEANLSKIHKHGHRADDIVKSMLQHSRKGSGTMEPVDLNKLVREFVSLAFHGMRAGKNSFNVDIEMALDEDVGEVPVIAQDFSRVIVNLCTNAFDAMKEKTDVKGETADGYSPKLTVKTFRENDQIIIEIEDNGPGIPEEIRDKIMQPFFTTKKGTGGTGLGLSITHDIVKAHGGTLQIETGADTFTKFIIVLPENSHNK